MRVTLDVNGERCGVAAAVANAVYNATGVRVRDYPITLDKLLAGKSRPWR